MKRKGYIGRIKNAGTQRVKALLERVSPGTGIVRQGSDLRTGVKK